MKEKLLAVSVLANVALILGLLWARADHQAELREYAIAVMRGDELHVRLHAASLEALEAPDSDQAMATADALRAIVEAGNLNIEARERAGMGKVGG